MDKQYLQIFTSTDGEAQLEVVLDKDIVWLNQTQMTELFDTSTDSISLHLKNIYRETGLEEPATTEDFSVVRQKEDRQVRRIRSLMESVRAQVQREAPGIYSKGKDLIKVIFRHPCTKIQFLMEAQIAKCQTASAYLQALAELGVLRTIKQGREMYYITMRCLPNWCGDAFIASTDQ